MFLGLHSHNEPPCLDGRTLPGGQTNSQWWAQKMSYVDHRAFVCFCAPQSLLFFVFFFFLFSFLFRKEEKVIEARSLNGTNSSPCQSKQTYTPSSTLFVRGFDLLQIYLLISHHTGTPFLHSRLYESLSSQRWWQLINKILLHSHEWKKKSFF